MCVWLWRRAIGIEIISEAARHLPDDLKRAEPGVPWRQVTGVGNVLRHGCDSVEDAVIYDIATSQLDELEAAVRRMLARLGE